MSAPSFAVVGQPNKGKSSIVATLAEDERVAISPTPGTTRLSEPFTFSVNGEPLYTLVDTPGFQRARAVLAWLTDRADDASQRSDLVAAFVDEHADDPKFHDECELLRPILAGAGILYVVDGAKPYGPEYEIEMQILRWTGQPRMALINRIGDGDYRAEWRRALDQYFSLVREFDAVGADFETRIGLLQAFRELNESWRAPLARAVDVLEGERRRRLMASAHEVTASLVYALTASEHARVETNTEALEEHLKSRLFAAVRQREARARDAVQNIYRHGRTQSNASELKLVELDLFSEEGWELFGLSREKLVVAGAVGGALAGGGFDLLVGGASLLLGSIVGGAIGGVTAWLGGGEIAKVKVLGEALGGDVMTVGPIAAPNFPWVLLGRAAMHHRLVSERNHARREAVSVEMAEQAHMMDRLPDELRRRLSKAFEVVRSSGEEGSEQLAAAVTEVFEWQPDEGSV